MPRIFGTGDFLPLTGGTLTGLLNINTNGNNVKIGSGNPGWCHFENSANIPFWFNQSICVNDGKDIGQSNFQYSPAHIYAKQFVLPTGSTSWIQGCKGGDSLYKPHVYNQNQFSPCWTVQTKGGGAWTCSNYDNENLVFSYGSKANIDSNNNAVNQIYFTNARRVNAAGYDTSSDRRLKNHIEYLDNNSNEFIKELKPVKFEMDDDIRYGFYAQDVQEICDNVDIVKEEETEEKMLSLDYQQLIAPLVATVQDLMQRVDELEATVADLKEQLGEQEVPS